MRRTYGESGRVGNLVATTRDRSGLLICLITLFLSLPLWTAWLPVSGAHDTTRLLQLALLTTIAVLSPPLPHQPLPTWATALFILWVTLASLTAALPTIALREITLWLGLVMLALQVGTWQPSRVRLLIQLMCGVCLLYGLMFCANLIGVALLDGEILPHALVFGFDNPRHLAHTQTVLIPLATGLAATANIRGMRALGWMAATLAFVVAAFLTSRATLLSVGVAFLALALVLRRQAWPYLRFGLSSMFIGASLGFGMLALFGIDLGAILGSTASGNERLKLWHAALDDAGRSLFGVGPMHFSRVPRGDAAHPHNVYLQAAAEFGWPAAIVLVIGVWVGLMRMGGRLRQRAPGMNRIWGMSLWVAVLAVAVDATLSGNLVMPSPQVWVFLAIGFAVGWYRDTDVFASRRLPPLWRGSKLTAVVMMSTLLCISAWEFFQPQVHLLESQQRHLLNEEVFSPRFWHDGWF